MEKVYDAHVHFTFNIPLQETVEIIKQQAEVTETEKFIFLAVPHHVSNGKLLTDDMQNIKAIYLKEAFSPNGYAFAGLIHSKNIIDENEQSNRFLAQVQKYYEEGYDGIKMLEGAPDMRKGIGIRLDSVAFDKFYSFCEENNYPITMHVANPDENWDYKLANKYAIEQGRVYDSTYPTKEQLTNEVFGVMKKHPKLRLSLAHCGFFSKNISYAERFLGEYENTILDVTPGGEQLINMSKEWDKWGKFFEKYQDRFVYGTDYYAFPKDENWEIAFNRRPKFLREFLETDKEHMYLDDKFKGVLLDKKILSKLYRENFVRLYGEPRKVDFVSVYKNCQKLLEKQERMTIEDINAIYLKDIEYKGLKNDQKLSDKIMQMKKEKFQLDLDDLSIMLKKFSN